MGIMNIICEAYSEEFDGEFVPASTGAKLIDEDDTSANHIVASDMPVHAEDQIAAREEWDAIAREVSDEPKTVA